MDNADDLHAEYRRARIHLEQTTRELDGAVARVAKILGMLRGQDYTSHDKTLRPNFVPGSSTWLEDMPSREELEKLLTKHDAARKAVVAAYGSLPNDERRHAPNLPNAAG